MVPNKQCLPRLRRVVLLSCLVLMQLPTAVRADPDAGSLSYARFADAGLDVNKATLAALPVVAGGSEQDCLAEALYFEARGESVDGQMAVAEVILNRLSSRGFPKTVCGVVHQGGEARYACQFTYHCDGRRDSFPERQAYEQVAKVARIMLQGRPLTLTEGATYYHTAAVKPRWSRRMTQTVTIGTHIFYRQPTMLTQN
jgi:spore germination cell wall hydrolase CwlJ-like protein